VFPILWPISLGPLGVQLAAIGAAIVLSYVYWRESVKKRGPAGRRATRVESALFALVVLVLALVLPRLFALPDPLVIEIRSYGASSAFGMFFGLYVQQRLGRRIGVPADRVFDMWLFGGMTGLALGRLIHVLVNWELYRHNPIAAIAFWDGGLVFLGALIGYLGYVTYTVIRHDLPAGTFDVLAIGLPAGHIFGRLGCFLAGCCFGEPTSLPWGVHFPEGSIALFALQSQGQLAADAAATMALHPTQLYEAGAELLIAIGLYLAWRRPHPAGAIACAYLIAYSVVRIPLEVVRHDPERGYLFQIPAQAPVMLSESQFLSLILIGVASVVLVWLRRRPVAAGGLS
jgi:phosphatidylglycerol:prolipoprotein diacylglycerol transferase